MELVKMADGQPGDAVLVDGVEYRLKYGLTRDDALSLVGAMAAEGIIAPTVYYKIAKMLHRAGIKVNDIGSHSFDDFPSRAGIGEKTRNVLLRLGISQHAHDGEEDVSADVSCFNAQCKRPEAYGRSLQTFSGMQTSWEGLWYHPEYGGYSSASISLAQIKKFKGSVRIYMRKNKYYQRGTNRPNYCFCLKDANSPTFTEIDVVEDGYRRLYTEEEVQSAIDDATSQMFTYEQVRSVLDGAARDGARGYEPDDLLVEDYL